MFLIIKYYVISFTQNTFFYVKMCQLTEFKTGFKIKLVTNN